MFRNSILAPLVVLAFTAIVYVGCSTSGDGGDGDAPQAFSFDGETSVPATGVASIAIDYTRGLGSIISSMLTAIAADASSESASKSLKILDDVDLGICTTGGSAVLNLPGAGGSGGSGGSDGGGIVELGDGSLTLTDCVGSPLSSTAINGIIELNGITIDLKLPVPPETLPTATMAATAEIAALEIAPSTNLAGDFAVAADIVVTSLNPFDYESIDLVLGSSPASSANSITVDDSGPTMRFGCFEIATKITKTPPAIDYFRPRGVLNLVVQFFTLNSFGTEPESVGFDLSSGTAVPNSGSLTLFSGDEPGCAPGVPPSDGSFATAEFKPEALVDIRAESSDGTVWECTEEWENLLETLRDIVFASCPCVENCGTGGTGGSGGSGGTAGSGGTGGSGGSGVCIETGELGCEGNEDCCAYDADKISPYCEFGTCCIPTEPGWSGCDPGFGMKCCGYPDSFCVDEGGVGVCKL